MTPEPHDWFEANQRFLTAAIAGVRTRVEHHLGHDTSADTDAFASDRVWLLPQPPALETIENVLGLSSFERDLLVLCAGCELDASFAVLCGGRPTFGLALATLSDAHWSALVPAGPLRRAKAIELDPGSTLTTSPLRIDETILHFLAGVARLDERLVPYLTLVSPMAMAPSWREVADRIVACWHDDSTAPPVVELLGGTASDRRACAWAACSAHGLGLFRLDANLLPVASDQLETVGRLWEREARLHGLVALIELDNLSLDGSDPNRIRTVARFVDHLDVPVILAGRERRTPLERRTTPILVRLLPTGERRAVWHSVLGESAARLNGQLDQIVSQFALPPDAIQTAVEAALIGDDDGLPDRLWALCRIEARPALDDLAQRIEPIATWHDLVLPPSRMETLFEIVAHVRERTTVYETWGFAAKGERGLGISALFAGSSGTGKTLAAEVLANELGIDLYRIDLSRVVSKYIGETEKNLSRVFDAAEGGGAVLLFDEADALFGKRSEVKDSHDRYANIEVSYLLQRMEAYRGLAILTTNQRNALDVAFLRRLRFVIDFPFPDATQRADIWRRVFPAATPTHDLQIDRLAQLNVAGGNIRNIALHAAFLAANAGQPVRMTHLAKAARGEYAKLEKTLTEAELGNWR